MKWTLCCLLALALFLSPGASYIAQAQSQVCAGLAAQMRKSHIPHVALATFEKGYITTAYCSAAGEALAPDAVFEAASLSKPVFALGVFMLAQTHRLDLDRPLSAYVGHPYMHQQGPLEQGSIDVVKDPRLLRVTARMVLSHTAGLPNWSRNRPLTFISNPGQRWSYSAEGYIYLQRVIESITGESLDVFLQATVLGPLGMTHSSFVWQESYAKTMLSGHAADGSVETAAHFAYPLASSTLYTTLDDYSRFVTSLLSPAPGSLYAMEEVEQVTVRPELKLAWSLGLAVEKTSQPSFFHWGANPGFQSFFLLQPGTGKGVLFLTDSDDGLDLVDSVVAQTVPGPHPSLRFPMLHPKD